MGAIRMNITLPAKTVAKLKKKVKPRNRSAVIARALEEYLDKSERNDLVRSMIEGYQSRAAEKTEEADLWNSTLTDGLDEEY
jgi:metal-responsive CopG/Arc/MetJ family transcriptional regulator